MLLNEYQQQLCTTSTWEFRDLRALYLNCTLKPSPGVSNTQGLMDISIAIMQANGVAVEQVRAVDHDFAAGVYPDMTEYGAVVDGVALRLRAGRGRRHPRDRHPDLAR
jgi:hypothetical protein